MPSPSLARTNPTSAIWTPVLILLTNSGSTWSGVAVRWTANQVAITIADDGPGFSPEVMGRMGEPYVTTRGVKSTSTDTDPIGLGLGFFIAKTLMERSGATLALANRSPPETGAVVRVRWNREDFERPPARPDELTP